MFIIMRGMCYYINLEGKSIMAYLDCPAEMECVIGCCGTAYMAWRRQP